MSATLGIMALASVLRSSPNGCFRAANTKWVLETYAVMPHNILVFEGFQQSETAMRISRPNSAQHA